jgi:Uma2 family endonuclease
MQPSTILTDPAWKPNPVSAINIADQASIPGWIRDLESFRRWARSDAYPEHGWFSYLHGEIWADPDMEQLFTHNQVKTQYIVVLGGLVSTARLGYFFSDRALLSNPAADLSTEPDGLFFTWETLSTGRIRLLEGSREGHVELEGTPDMALEVVSSHSVRKDTVLLKDLYWRAGIQEYWLVDVRRGSLHFNILRHTPEGYSPTGEENGWLRSEVFGRAFHLKQEADPLGHPRYTLAIQS